MNLRESDPQRELSRSTKSSEEAYRIALSYGRGERAYKSYTGKPDSAAPHMTIKQEPVSSIRRGQGYFRNRGREGRGGYTPGQTVSKTETVDVRFVMHQILRWISFPTVQGKEYCCNACRKVGHFERTCKGVRRGTNHWRGCGRVSLVRDENEHHRSTHSVDNTQEVQVAWVNQQHECGEEISTSSESDDYMVMSIKKKNAIELKIPGARIQVEVSLKKMWLWFGSGSP